MAKLLKIFIIIMVVIIVVTLLAALGLKFWARGDRISPENSRSLVLDAWRNSESESIDGVKIVEYRIADRIYRVKPDYTNYPKLPVLEELLENLFSRMPFEKSEEFLNTVDIRHSGRTRIAGRNVERIAVSPREYSGHSTELLIDAENNDLLGWRRLDENGGLVRGWHYREITHSIPTVTGDGSDLLVEEILENSSLFERRELLSGDELAEMAERRAILLPEWVPPGFHLLGGRWVHGIGPQNELEQLAPGIGLGRMRQQFGMGGGGRGGGAGGQFQLVYTDGLNTISLTLMPNQRFGQALGDPQRVEQILEDKGNEIRRLFHTSMAAKIFPGRLVLAFGGVDEGILRRMIESIPFDPAEMGFPEPGPGERPDQLRPFPPDPNGERRPGDRFPGGRPGGGPPGGGRVPGRGR